MSKEAKKEILNIIIKTLMANPDMRFNQVLFGLNIVDKVRDTFYDHDLKVLKRAMSSQLYKQIKENQ